MAKSSKQPSVKETQNKRAVSWTKAQEKKALNRDKQLEREKKNLTLKRKPWDIAKANRAALRGIKYGRREKIIDDVLDDGWHGND